MAKTSFNRYCLGNINASLLVFNIIGVVLSMYAYRVSVSKRSSPEYQALCDISQTMSCSRVLTSQYSIGFGIIKYLFDESSVFNQTNSVYGIFYYFTFAALSFSANSFICRIELVMAVISNLGSVYLAMVLIMLQDICVICVTTYFINALNYLLLSRKITLIIETNKTQPSNRLQ